MSFFLRAKKLKAEIAKSIKESIALESTATEPLVKPTINLTKAKTMAHKLATRVAFLQTHLKPLKRF